MDSKAIEPLKRCTHRFRFGSRFGEIGVAGSKHGVLLRSPLVSRPQPTLTSKLGVAD